MKTVAFLELPVFSGVVPLASGYMEAYCLQDIALATTVRFEKLSLVVQTPEEEIIKALLNLNADVYAFSCYVWNSRLVRRVLNALVREMPRAAFILGGPQVMHQAHKYLNADHENVYLCNGEGEKTFANFLRALFFAPDSMTNVRGLSLYRSGKQITTDPEPRIGDLSELPSPYLLGLIEEKKYPWAIIETNRGCPFTCSYCFWGAATGGRVNKFDEERLKREVEWISRSGAWSLFIADANWGMLPRDVALSQHIVDCQRLHGGPLSVYFCGSKNTPDRVSEITGIFSDAGLVTTQSVALQTMDPDALSLVNRGNIKTSAYTEMQLSLNERKISSFLELIWPLPGETLASFQDGIGKLCALGADSFVVYPLLLMNNVALSDKVEEFGLVTVADPEPNSEATIVVETNQVTPEDYRNGVRFVYTVMSLYALRGLWYLGRYLSTSGACSYKDLFSRFTNFCQSDPGNPWTLFCESSIDRFEHVTYANSGAIAHLTMHEERQAFDDLLIRFVETSFWHDEVAQVMFELDLINRPYIYKNTPIVAKKYDFKHLSIIDVASDGYLVGVPIGHRDAVASALDVAPAELNETISVLHRRKQHRFMPSKSLHDNYIYCNDIAQRSNAFTGLWQPAVVKLQCQEA